MGWKNEESDLIPGRIKTFFSSPKYPYWLWCPPSLLCSSYKGDFPREYSSCSTKATTYVHCKPRL